MLDSEHGFGGNAASYFDRLIPQFESAGAGEFFPGIAGVAVLASYSADFGRISTFAYDFRPSGPFEIQVDGDRPRLVAVLDHVGGRLKMAVDGVPSGIPHGPISFDAMGMTGGELPVIINGDGVSFLRVLVIEFHVSHPDECGDDEPLMTTTLRPGLRIATRDLQAIIHGADARCRSGQAPGESPDLAGALLIALNSCPDSEYDGGLAAWQLSRIQRYVHDNLSQSLLLKDLANQIRLSTSHFCRAFKASTGTAPHRWIMKMRCDRAKELLLDEKLSLVEVALEVGFSDQSHFTRAFGRTTGSRPGAWRGIAQRELGGTR